MARNTRSRAGRSPRPLESPFNLGQVDPTIPLATSSGRLMRGKQILELDKVRVFLAPSPTLGIRFEGSARSREASAVKRAFDQWRPQRLSLAEPATAGSTYEDATQLGGDYRKRPYKIAAQGHLREMRGGRGRSFGSLIFHVPNFPNFIGDRITDGPGWWRGRLELDSGSWHVRLDARRELSELTSGLRERGGYAITHIGRLDRGGDPFNVEEAEDCLTALHWFLSFVRGGWTAPILVEGRSVRGRKTFRLWSVGRVDRGVTAFRWCDDTVWQAAQEAFVGYMARWADPAWQQGLRVAIGQYVSANKPNPMESAIIAAQSGLELLGWLHLVEDRQVVPAPDWDRRRADWKIRELLRLAKVDPAIPTRLRRLAGVNQAWNDGPDVIAGIRNELVHPTRANGRFGRTGEVLLEGWLLASRYLELGLLYSMDVTSPVRDRLNPNVWVGTVSKPPWA